MTSFLRVTAFWAILGLIGAALVVGFGLYNVSARQGHLPGVSWVLHTTYRNAVKLRAPAEEAVPDLSGEDMIALGAGHYDSACRFCHAAPGEQQSETAESMEPPPPHITDAVAHWEPRHLFWIVKNGVKMSGMPAWPSAKRDDEVWSVVAFLNAIEGMEAARYEELVASASDQSDSAEASVDAPDRAAYCATCHARGGEKADNGIIPRLDRLQAPYLKASLNAYRTGARHSGVMQHAASTLSDQEIEALATYFAKPSPDIAAEGGDAVDAALIDHGEALAAGPSGRPNLPACQACHGPWPTEREILFPNLAGQHRAYLLAQLDLWSSGIRGGSALAEMMHQVAPELDDRDKEALAAYYASLPPEPALQANLPAGAE